MIYWNAELAKRLLCSDEEKAALPYIIKNLLSIASKARIEGLKSLMNDATIPQDALLSYGFRLIAEGLAIEALEEILAIYLATSTKIGFDFLKQCVYAETLVSIASGDSVDLTLRKLAPYCGAERAYALLESIEAESIS